MSENTDIRKAEKVAIVLLNLGGPDSLNSVQSFLFNLFYDPAIIRLPNPLRFLIAKLISFIRTEKAKAIYALIGNKSPILAETILQKKALADLLAQKITTKFEIFICMRHWHPRAYTVIDQIKQYQPQEIILLPLYPQFSTTTTGSAINEFRNLINNSEINKVPIKTICCYSGESDYIKAHLILIKQAIAAIKDDAKFRILFSAHSLPVKIINEGDPYQWQIEQTVKQIIAEINIKDLDYRISYQSKVGPVEWLKPTTEDEIKNAGIENKSLIVVPIAFVSEHVETLVELDIEYGNIANLYQIQYIRVATLRISELFINSLANIIQRFINNNVNDICSSSSLKRICPDKFVKCPCNRPLI